MLMWRARVWRARVWRKVYASEGFYYHVGFILIISPISVIFGKNDKCSAASSLMCYFSLCRCWAAECVVLIYFFLKTHSFAMEERGGNMCKSV